MLAIVAVRDRAPMKEYNILTANTKIVNLVTRVCQWGHCILASRYITAFDTVVEVDR